MPALPPFILRPYQPTDFDAALAVIQAAEQADDLPLRTSAADLRARLAAPRGEAGLETADDRWVAVVGEPGVAAYADGWLVGEGAERSYRMGCFVHPQHRGRGIGRALLARQCERAQTIARRLAAAGSPVTVTVGARALEQQPAAVAVLEAGGLERVRTHLQMRRDLSQPLPPPASPAGLPLEPWTDPRADEAVWRAYDEAFADHWGYQYEPFDSFMHHMVLGGVQRENSFIAWAGGQVAGGSLNDMFARAEGSRAGELAWIHHLFVRRDWRGRGLGRALVAASLARARQLGYATAVLNVDADNPTGAVPLYAGAGFVVATHRYVYQRAFKAANDAGRGPIFSPRLLRE